MATEYHIRLKGHLADHWSAWFDEMTISNEANGEAVLCGPLPDQAALHGVLINPADGPLGEELGWRGYALPDLQAKRSPLAAACTGQAIHS
jgi:membrane protease YdiL (CAAX protease family)